MGGPQRRLEGSLAFIAEGVTAAQVELGVRRALAAVYCMPEDRFSLTLAMARPDPSRLGRPSELWGVVYKVEVPEPAVDSLQALSQELAANYSLFGEELLPVLAGVVEAEAAAALEGSFQVSRFTGLSLLAAGAGAPDSGPGSALDEDPTEAGLAATISISIAVPFGIACVVLLALAVKPCCGSSKKAVAPGLLEVSGAAPSSPEQAEFPTTWATATGRAGLAPDGAPPPDVEQCRQELHVEDVDGDLLNPHCALQPNAQQKPAVPDRSSMASMASVELVPRPQFTPTMCSLSRLESQHFEVRMQEPGLGQAAAQASHDAPAPVVLHWHSRSQAEMMGRKTYSDLRERTRGSFLSPTGPREAAASTARDAGSPVAPVDEAPLDAAAVATGSCPDKQGLPTREGAADKEFGQASTEIERSTLYKALGWSSILHYVPRDEGPPPGPAAAAQQCGVAAASAPGLPPPPPSPSRSQPGAGPSFPVFVAGLSGQEQLEDEETPPPPPGPGPRSLSKRSSLEFPLYLVGR